MAIRYTWNLPSEATLVGMTISARKRASFAYAYFHCRDVSMFNVPHLPCRNCVIGARSLYFGFVPPTPPTNPPKKAPPGD
jgi:hypothetical protein